MADSALQARTVHPVLSVLVSSALPLFLGAVLSDWTYSSTYQVQWVNFASWLIAGALVFTGLALVWSLASALRSPGGWLLVGLLAATFVVGFIDALVHAKDAWGAMPAGLILSVVTLVLAIASAWAALWSRRVGADR